MDILQREGHYPLPPGAPETLGVEFSGTIAEVGEGCKPMWKLGDEVIGLALGVSNLFLGTITLLTARVNRELTRSTSDCLKLISCASPPTFLGKRPLAFPKTS